jgi:hypothetical protein
MVSPSTKGADYTSHVLNRITDGGGGRLNIGGEWVLASDGA